MKRSDLRKIIQEEIQKLYETKKFVARYDNTDIFIHNLDEDIAEKLYNDIGKLLKDFWYERGDGKGIGKLKPKKVEIKF